MSLADQLDAWNNISGGNSASTYDKPSYSDMGSASFGGSSSPVGIGDFLSAGSDILGGIGGYMQGQESAGADEYNASLALIEGKFAEEQLSKDEGLTLSTQKAMYARAGVENSGSTLDVALQTATNYEYDKQVAKFNAQSKANMYDYEAKVAKQKGQFDLGMGLLQGGASLAMALI